ncbi:MAG: glucose-6-phosphate isomerase [Opitutales bacterium]
MKKDLYLSFPEIGFSSDFSYVDFPADFLASMEEKATAAISAMKDLESGAIANPDENRMVGHYWLRSSELAPTNEIGSSIRDVLAKTKDLADRVHSGELQSPSGPFTDLLVIGIGGSALGPQFVGSALRDPGRNKLNVSFFDNTDPDGMDLVLEEISERLSTTLVIVISKSGGTPETRNGMLEAEAFFARRNLDFAKQAIAITGDGSTLHQHATQGGWLDFIPMWDWVGGRTSETAAVGLLPAALQGIDVDDFLAGAAKMDVVTRHDDFRNNPAALLALAWYYLTDGRGSRDMVVLPYKDRLSLFAKYLQQLVMESLGKELDLAGNVVQQGIAVYGNKGSTDQHAYVQQLREGVPNFFVTFIEVRKHRAGESPAMDEDGMTSGEYLNGFLLGTRSALYENDRKSITLSIEDVTPSSVGGLIALFERAVGLYASLISINAYHQPGVEAGKKAASAVLAVRKTIKSHLNDNSEQSYNAEELAIAIGTPEQTAWVFGILQDLAANQPENFIREAAQHPFDDRFSTK